MKGSRSGLVNHLNKYILFAKEKDVSDNSKYLKCRYMSESPGKISTPTPFSKKVFLPTLFYKTKLKVIEISPPPFT